jgi:hypothetical protein
MSYHQCKSKKRVQILNVRSVLKAKGKVKIKSQLQLYDALHFFFKLIKLEVARIINILLNSILDLGNFML